ncbi:hypothetical protein D1953_11205 [Peribacillus asahii]|uniref:YugN-like family protein n=1 Tax=Peribacillus asahii TaxID=228899 RepID=A0A398B966_9BACI|nr:YugN-like family protein [Peribacillus asahii]RID85378.1 hypothetical protein D1953_11205 [Peribacillus asahii]
MIEVSSKLEGKTFSLWDLEQKLKPLGYVIGGNWDYDHGSFDYLIDNKEGYQFLRLPFQAVDGTLDRDGAKVELLRPYLLAHQYEGNLDYEGNISNFSASFNQFATPEDSDADFPEKYISYGKSLVQDVEKALL